MTQHAVLGEFTPHEQLEDAYAGRMKISHVLAVLLFLAFPLGRAAPAEKEAVGMVTAVRGKVQARQDDGGERVLKLRSLVFSQDVIVTGKRGRAQLLFQDDILVCLGRDCTLRVGDLLTELHKTPGGLKELEAKNVLVSGDGTWRVEERKQIEQLVAPKTTIRTR